MGRFVTPDPKGHPGDLRLNDPQSLNPYPYARNNPLKYTDPDGAAFYDVTTVERLNRNQLEALTGEFVKRALACEKPTVPFYHKPHISDVGGDNWVAGVLSLGPTTRMQRTNFTSKDYTDYPLIQIQAMKWHADIPVEARDRQQFSKIGVEKKTGVPVIQVDLGGMLVSGKKIVKSRGNIVIITGTQETINEYLNPLGYQVVAVENRYVVETFKSGTK